MENQLTMAINFISSKDSDETRTMHAKSNNVEIIMGSETNEIIEEIFKSFLQRYQEGLAKSMRGSEFIFDSVDALHYDLNKFKLKPFIDQYNFPSHRKDWKKFESNNKTIAYKILYVPYNTEEIRHAYKSKYNLKRESQVILLMITDGKKWHYLAVKNCLHCLEE